jgi:hypothetical protein
MKKFYSLFVVLVLAVSVSFGQKVAVLAADLEDPNVIAIKDAVASAWAGIEASIEDVAGIGDWDEATWGQYDLIVMTENGGSSSGGNYAPVGMVTVPIVSLKAYAIKKAAPAWDLITGDADQWWAETKDSSQVNYDYTYSGVVAVDHPIWGGWYTVGDEFVWTESYNENQGDEAHVQCFDLLKSTHPEVVSNATLLATNKFAADETGSDVDGFLWAIEENAYCQAAVIWGVHHEFMTAATDAFFGIIQNSMAWVLGMEEMPWTKPVEQSIAQNHAADFAFKVFPNPVVETATIQFNLDTPANIYLAVNDIVGKTVFEMNDTFNQGAQEIQIDASDLASGVYFVQMNVNDRVASLKLIVE